MGGPYLELAIMTYYLEKKKDFIQKIHETLERHEKVSVGEHVLYAEPPRVEYPTETKFSRKFNCLHAAIEELWYCNKNKKFLEIQGLNS
jgi:hypothetical protein